jgi:hypothetical protein
VAKGLMEVKEADQRKKASLRVRRKSIKVIL